MSARIALRVPDRALLGAYEAALREGWSPNTVRNVAPEQLAAIAADPDAFLGKLVGRGGRIRLDDGTEVDKIPDRVRWVFALDRPGEPFVGAINLRWLEDEAGRAVEALPPHVLGHVGYSIRPAFAGNGYATAALEAMREQAREIGLPRLVITCDATNLASRHVIEKNGGRLVETFVAPIYGPDPRLKFIVDIAPQPPAAGAGQGTA
ncbi:GNAT family N-acetyltransferase [Bosea sp. TND4EK4]|uniref:GNAT family N-acetyltransferase n=1 Tax=Bosea sp. TND4EK4 TaxID=1907408 RepID=UPI000953A57C|nr:GNAT family N-acetyltransferase [Bosea sp. TND4EK4]SIP91521.1 Predicted acetyltransferase [Bosea sp. TND4EK4]